MFMSSGTPVLTRSSALENRPDSTRLVLRLTSTVLSMRRVSSAGMRKPWSSTAFAKSRLGYFGRHLQLDQAVADDLRRELEADTELLETESRQPPIGRLHRRASSERPESGSRRRRGTSPVSRFAVMIVGSASRCALPVCSCASRNASRSSVPKSVRTVRNRVARWNRDPAGGRVDRSRRCSRFPLPTRTFLSR